MTTDITELAQREKFEAWAEEAGALPWGILGKHRKQDGNYPGPHYTYMWKAWQAASAELVEELELKEEQRANWFQMAQKLGEDLDAAEKRIAELESRTVKMPEPFKLAKSSSGLTYYFADDVDTALAAAGIKWEAE